MASLPDLLTVVYRPRSTMRRILDGDRDRWTIQIVILATICASVSSTDIRPLQKALPDVTLGSALALIVLNRVFDALCWAIVLYLFAWLAMFVGRKLDGHGNVTDVRAATAWGVVPVIWSVILRIPIVIYGYRLVPETHSPRQLVVEFIANGGCSFAILLLTFQLLLLAWMLYVTSGTIGEALHFSSWKGLATIAIVVAVPVVIGLAAYFTHVTRS